MNIKEDPVYVTAVRKDKGRLTGFRLNDGRELDFAQCYQAVERGEIPSLSTGTARNGEATIRSKRGYEDYKLDDLPTF